MRARRVLIGAGQATALVGTGIWGLAVSAAPRSALDALHPHKFAYGLADALANSRDGAGRSCSLHALYMYVLLRNHKTFDPKGFVAFRGWATREGLFHTQPGEQGVVDLEGLARRLPEFFGGQAQALDYRFFFKGSDWSAGVAEALSLGHSVVALTALTSDTRTADHIVTILSAQRDAAGGLVGFLIHDPNSYRAWETSNFVKAEELAARLAKPAELEGGLVAIAASAKPAYKSSPAK